MSNDVSDSELYYNRRSEDALRRDFPADAAIIDALYRWQMQIWNYGNGQIPILRVMNCAHRVAAHMLSGLYPYDDRNGYDYRIFRDMDNDRFLMSIVIVVLVAMLRCIEDSDRARTCINIITDDRPEDFYERLSLFNDYVNTSCKMRCREKDLLQDATELVERIAQLEAQQQQDKSTIQTLQKKIDMMENETKHIAYNVEQMTINMSGGTLVQHADLVQASGEVVIEKTAGGSNQPSAGASDAFFCRITDEARRNDKAKAVEEELRCACISAPKLIKAIRTNEALGYLSTNHLSSIELYNLLHEHFNLPFKSHNFAKYRSKRE